MPYESNDKMVSHPAHYQSNGMEVIDVIESFTSDLTGIEAVDTGNVIKYICRWKHKNGVQDLEKARWYLEHLIEHIKESNSKPETVVVPNIKGDNSQPETVVAPNIHMSKVCRRCNNVIEQAWDNWTLADCEGYCRRYCDCQNVIMANDILKVKGD